MNRQSAKRAAMDPWKRQQREHVIERSDGLCEFEVAYIDIPLGETHTHQFGASPQRIVERGTTPDVETYQGFIIPGSRVAWARCGRAAVGYGSGLAHIFRRHKNGVHLTDDGPPLMFHPLAVLAACGDCHRNFDSRHHPDEVRVPAAMLAAAKRLIVHTLEAARARGEAGVDVDLSHT